MTTPDVPNADSPNRQKRENPRDSANIVTNARVVWSRLYPFRKLIAFLILAVVAKYEYERYREARKIAFMYATVQRQRLDAATDTSAAPVDSLTVTDTIALPAPVRQANARIADSIRSSDSARIAAAKARVQNLEQRASQIEDERFKAQLWRVVRLILMVALIGFIVGDFLLASGLHQYHHYRSALQDLIYGRIKKIEEADMKMVAAQGKAESKAEKELKAALKDLESGVANQSERVSEVVAASAAAAAHQFDELNRSLGTLTNSQKLLSSSLQLLTARIGDLENRVRPRPVFRQRPDERSKSTEEYLMEAVDDVIKKNLQSRRLERDEEGKRSDLPRDEPEGA